MIEQLKKTRLFEGLDESILKKISAFSKLEKLKSNETLIREDSVDNFDLFIVVKGRVKIFVSSKFFADDREESKTICTINQGEIFGEMSCIVKRRRTASAVTMGDVEIIRIDGIKFNELIENDKTAGFDILKKLYELLYDRIENSNFMLRNFLI